MKKKDRIAVFASGNGTNAEAIFRHFEGHPNISVVRLLSNKAEAGVLQRAARYGINTTVFGRKQFYDTTEVTALLQADGVNWVVLAGFLWLVPQHMLTAYPQRIVNIHPALLPKYGGKGMYGMHVHQAVKAANETVSGITIHYANERYDEGGIIMQAACEIGPSDSAEEIAQKVQKLEHQHYPTAIEDEVRKSSKFS